MSSVRSVPLRALPIIDIAPLWSPKSAERRRVSEQIRAACLDKGFFYIANHGIAAELIDAALEQTRRLFDLPLAAKSAVGRDHSRCRRGYEPFGGQILEPGTPPDRKEAFDLGIDLPEDDPRVIEGKPDHGPNLWPETLPDFRPIMDAYLAAMLNLSLKMLEGLAVSLDLNADYFHALCRDPVVFLRLLHYPPQPAVARPGEKGAGAHTDWGAITLLWQDARGGLQVLDGGDGWIHVPPMPGCYVVNLGDLMARWTNDRYRSTVHRVVNLSGQDRYSIPFFMDGNPDYCVACLPNCSTPDNPPKYAPITVTAHTEEKYRQAFAKGASDG